MENISVIQEWEDLKLGDSKAEQEDIYMYVTQKQNKMQTWDIL